MLVLCGRAGATIAALVLRGCRTAVREGVGLAHMCSAEHGRPVIRGDLHGVQLPTANGHAQRGRRPAVILQDEHDAGGLPVVLAGAITPCRVGVFVE
jgi:hypothetical protein